MQETTALAQGLQLIPQSVDIHSMEAPVGKRREDMVAVVGAESSTNTKQLAELLGLFAIPQVCYSFIYLQYVSSECLA